MCIYYTYTYIICVYMSYLLESIYLIVLSLVLRSLSELDQSILLNPVMSFYRNTSLTHLYSYFKS